MDYRNQKNFRLIQAWRNPILHFASVYCIYRMTKSQLEYYKDRPNQPTYILYLYKVK